MKQISKTHLNLFQKDQHLPNGWVPVCSVKVRLCRESHSGPVENLESWKEHSSFIQDYAEQSLYSLEVVTHLCGTKYCF